MFIPIMGTRIKQWGELIGFRIHRSKIWSLKQVALRTCKRKIRQLVSTSVLTSTNVLYMKS